MVKTGALVWVKFAQYPFWPGIVYSDTTVDGMRQCKLLGLDMKVSVTVAKIRPFDASQDPNVVETSNGDFDAGLRLATE